VVHQAACHCLLLLAVLGKQALTLFIIIIIIIIIIKSKQKAEVVTPRR